VNIHGHGNEYLANVVKEQILRLDHTLFAGFTHKPAVHFATKFLDLLQCNQQRVFYSENGSTAVEVALKLSVQYWKNKGQHKTVFIALDGSFHGDTFGAMSVSARGLFTKSFEPLLTEVLYLPYPDGTNDTAVLEQLETYLQNPNVAAFIYEPLIQGSGGMRIYAPELLEQLMLLCKRYNVLCIADEVMTGFGRTGRAFASHYCTTTPDIMCFSKAITGGLLPLGVTTCTSMVEEPFKTADIHQAFYHGHSYMANPTICQLALASLSLFDSAECSANIQRITIAHKNIAQKMSSHTQIKRIQTLGTILVIELHTKNGISNYEHELRHYLYDYFINHGILLRPLGNIIYVMPPYIIDDQELEVIYATIEKMLESL
ncbi:MAG: adenosylmethionine--8-amino-7-oxononanoate transaminase, partial [Cytophagales bacterium]|nr:adenosylmethionine--8-amino-7-oxononanoate transaminase [Cytophaga sp.]